ncbi:hypothetical protein [Metabacillus fastidiosus]|uniref:hypothetical protein n=1 Tax=Metabacillus fastidiosus TaxID=1458 RepID=UPI003D2B6441
MKLFSLFQRQSQKLSENENFTRSIEELSEEEMKLVQGASSNDTNESLYNSYAWLVENRRILP